MKHIPTLLLTLILSMTALTATADTYTDQAKKDSHTASLMCSATMVAAAEIIEQSHPTESEQLMAAGGYFYSRLPEGSVYRQAFPNYLKHINMMAANGAGEKLDELLEDCVLLYNLVATESAN